MTFTLYIKRRISYLDGILTFVREIFTINYISLESLVNSALYADTQNKEGDTIKIVLGNGSFSSIGSVALAQCKNDISTLQLMARAVNGLIVLCAKGRKRLRPQ